MTAALPPPELTRLIKVRPLPAEPVIIEASVAERAALARRFGLGAVDHLRTEVALDQKPRAIRATGRLQAAILQPCAISGEDFPVQINEAIDLRFVDSNARAPTADEEIELEADDCDEIEYAGDMFDLGEAVAQTLGLAIDPYAEGPNADAARKAAGIIREGELLGPMAAALSALKKD